jgi:AAA+ ATPase superfamily predicted ATPase
LKFYDRTTELKALETACSKKGAEMIVVSGRRRIGKSRLINEFLKKREAVKILIVPKEERQVANDFATALSDGYLPSFSNVEEALEYFFNNSKKQILFIDEFPNLLEVHSSIPYAFQRVWEKHCEISSKILIFSGSYVSMMNKIFTEQKAPLFNRAGYLLVLQPLKLGVVWEIQQDLGVDATEKIRNYCILGGVPFYYELLEKWGIKNAVNNLFFDVAAPLREEGQNVLRQEFGASYKKYFSIIEAIGAGVVNGSEIADRLGMSQTTLSKYIIALQRDFQLVERSVPFGQNPQRSKKGLYSIKDNAVAFWFAHVYGKLEPPKEDKINDFVSKRFKMFCKDFFVEYLKSKGESVIRTGSWWGQLEVKPNEFEDKEIDFIAETQESLYFAECKWTNKKTATADLYNLKKSSAAFLTKKMVKQVIFSKSGFDFNETKNTMLFCPERLEMEILRLREPI